MDQLLFSHIPSYLNKINDLITCSRKMGVDRKFIVRCKKYTYFKHFVIKIVYSHGSKHWYKYGKRHRRLDPRSRDPNQMHSLSTRPHETLHRVISITAAEDGYRSR